MKGRETLWGGGRGARIGRVLGPYAAVPGALAPGAASSLLRGV